VLFFEIQTWSVCIFGDGVAFALTGMPAVNITLEDLTMKFPQNHGGGAWLEPMFRTLRKNNRSLLDLIVNNFSSADS